jgi:PKD repeat protein
LGFGDKTTSIEIDPIKTYAGKYTVVLTAKK